MAESPPPSHQNVTSMQKKGVYWAASLHLRVVVVVGSWLLSPSKLQRGPELSNGAGKQQSSCSWPSWLGLSLGEGGAGESIGAANKIAVSFYSPGSLWQLGKNLCRYPANGWQVVSAPYLYIDAFLYIVFLFSSSYPVPSLWFCLQT